MIDVDVLDSEYADEDSSINHESGASVEYDRSGLVGAGVTEEVEDMKKALKYSSFFVLYVETLSFSHREL